MRVRPGSSGRRMAVEPANVEYAFDSPPTETSVQWPLLAIMRPKQWVKNGLVLAPLLFAGLFTDTAAISDALLAAGLFCVASAATYVWNDLNDIEADRAHPVKRHTRPLAAGAMQPSTAKLQLVGLLVLLAVGSIVEPWAMAAIGAYLAVNLAYSAWLKDEPVIDLFSISAGFVLRVFAGALAVGVAVSPWMLITTLCLALYLATQKRLSEQAENGDQARSVLAEYSPELLERYSQLTALGAIVFYGLYTATVRPALAYTMPFVLFGFLRYAYLSERDQTQDPIGLAFRDRSLVAAVGGWAIAAVWLLWPA